MRRNSFSENSEKDLAANRSPRYPLRMTASAILITIQSLEKQLEQCEQFSDWEGCERIEEEISAMHALLEEKNI